MCAPRKFIRYGGFRFVLEAMPSKALGQLDIGNLALP